MNIQHITIVLFFWTVCTGFQLTGMDPFYQTALVDAAASGNREQVQALWHFNEQLYRYTHAAEPALLAASEHGHHHIVNFLIANGVDTRTHSDRALYNAAEVGSSELVSILYDIIHADMMRTFDPEQKEIDQQAIDSAYIQAASYGQLHIVVQLHDKASSPALHTRALRNAAFNGHAAVVTHLIQQGTIFHAYAELSLEDTPLHAAALNGHTHIVRLLLDDQTSADELNDALLAAKYGKHYDTISALSVHGITLSGKRPSH